MTELLLAGTCQVETEPHSEANTAIEHDFPCVPVSLIAEKESWRKELNRPIYHIHKWWATRLGSVFRAIALSALSESGADVWGGFYERHDLSGRVVLDPFMGSGTTLGEVLKLGAKAVGCDINPVSSFLVRQAFTRVDDSLLKSAFAHLEETVAPSIREFYQTIDPITDEKLQVLYFFWVKFLFAPSGEVIPLFDRYVFAQDAYPQKKPIAQIVCPSCWSIMQARFDSLEESCPNCGLAFNPQEGPARGSYVRSRSGVRYRIKDLLDPTGKPPGHRLYALLAIRSNGEKIYLRASAFDEALYAEAEARLTTESIPLPILKVRPGHNTQQAINYNYREWRDFFNSRQLLCLGLLLKAILQIPQLEIREQMLCLFSSSLEFNNLFCSYKGEGTGAVRHMFSHHILKPERTPLENSVWGGDRTSGTFASLFESRLLRAKQYLNEPFDLLIETDLLGKPLASRKIITSDPLPSPPATIWSDLETSKSGVLILNGSSSALAIPNESVDAVITDPPYFDFIHYSELSDFFFAWLAPVLCDTYPWFDKQNSGDKEEVQQKDPQTFALLLASVFSECRRVLKPNGVLAFSFHHSKEEGWAAIGQAIRESGFRLVAAHHVHAELRGSSPKTGSSSPISLDAILVCRKDDEVEGRKTPLREIIGEAISEAEKLAGAGMVLSESDYFVIAASKSLLETSAETLDFGEQVSRLTVVRRLLQEELLNRPTRG